MSDANDARGASGRSPLFLAAIGVAGLFLLLIAAVAFFGSAKDGNPEVTMKLPPVTQGPVPERPPPISGEARRVNGYLVADPALLEETPEGPLPRIGDDGRKPMDAYAPTVEPNQKGVRIALVLTGLGVGDSESTVALGRLPPQITVAVSPYAKEPQEWADKARGEGHEVLVELPMEPFDFPDSDPGPRTLLVAASAQENEKRLTWMLTRFTGYVGAVNSQGGRFLSESSALEPVIAFLAKRGILWVDVSSGDNSATAGAAARQKALAVAGAMRIDAIQTPEAIDAKLLDLEDRAKDAGFAVGVASGYLVSIDRIAEWAQRAQARGVVLVPVGAVAGEAANAPAHP